MLSSVYLNKDAFFFTYLLIRFKITMKAFVEIWDKLILFQKLVCILTSNIRVLKMPLDFLLHETNIELQQGC